ncbi:MAG: hypothetical protein H6619_01020 [Deltaproteobacteria bacterium]|nr:hypothetical protein [Deltaproteobacteria bacterium]
MKRFLKTIAFVICAISIHNLDMQNAVAQNSSPISESDASALALHNQKVLELIQLILNSLDARINQIVIGARGDGPDDTDPCVVEAREILSNAIKEGIGYDDLQNKIKNRFNARVVKNGEKVLYFFVDNDTGNAYRIAQRGEQLFIALDQNISADPNSQILYEGSPEGLDDWFYAYANEQLSDYAISGTFFSAFEYIILRDLRTALNRGFSMALWFQISEEVLDAIAPASSDQTTLDQCARFGTELILADILKRLTIMYGPEVLAACSGTTATAVGVGVAPFVIVGGLGYLHGEWFAENCPANSTKKAQEAAIKRSLEDMIETLIIKYVTNGNGLGGSITIKPGDTNADVSGQVTDAINGLTLSENSPDIEDALIRLFAWLAKYYYQNRDELSFSKLDDFLDDLEWTQFTPQAFTLDTTGKIRPNSPDSDRVNKPSPCKIFEFLKLIVDYNDWLHPEFNLNTLSEAERTENIINKFVAKLKDSQNLTDEQANRIRSALLTLSRYCEQYNANSQSSSNGGTTSPTGTGNSTNTNGTTSGNSQTTSNNTTQQKPIPITPGVQIPITPYTSVCMTQTYYGQQNALLCRKKKKSDPNKNSQGTNNPPPPPPPGGNGGGNGGTGSGSPTGKPKGEEPKEEPNNAKKPARPKRLGATSMSLVAFDERKQELVKYTNFCSDVCLQAHADYIFAPLLNDGERAFCKSGECLVLNNDNSEITLAELMNRKTPEDNELVEEGISEIDHIFKSMPQSCSEQEECSASTHSIQIFNY